MKRIVAVDLGATSGRVMVARVSVDPDVLELDEVHRFPNGGVRAADGSLRWDIERIHDEVLTGLRMAAEQGPVDGIGIDSWAIDYGLLDSEGELLGQPYSHRDSRTDGVMDEVLGQVDASRLYDVTGIQQLPFNTLYQLVEAHGSAAYEHAATLLLLPDLLAYWLTGQVRAERTNASTTQFYDARSREWALPLLEELGLRTDVLPPLCDPGEVVGTLRGEVATRIGLPADTPVIAVGSHDTASAVVGVPARDDHGSAYVSSGTWSLVGVEVPAPILTEEARSADFTNEAGVDDTVRFLKNVMGLWVLSECVRHWHEHGDPVELELLLAEAADLPPLRSLVDVDDSRLLPPGDMPGRLVTLAEESGEPVPRTPAEFTRLVLDSLALAYRRTVRAASTIAGVSPEVVHVVGGGSQNRVLCQLTADACGLPVVAGPTEAAALGNVLVQARTLGLDLPDLTAMRRLLRETQTLERYEPASTRAWDDAEARLGQRVVG
jgi:rhamnulokinase